MPLVHLLTTAVTAVLVGGAPGAAHRTGPATCEGTLSGDVKARFTCAAVVGTLAPGAHAFVITIPGPIDGIPSVVPGAFELPAPVKRGTYTLDELGMGKASVAAEGGLLYTAAKTSSQRGEVTLELRSVRKSRNVPGAFEVRGRYRARLVPVGAGRSGEVVVDVRF
jgi:hypothetical protein